MTFLALTFLVSLVITSLIIRSASRHGGMSGDYDVTGPQKFHTRPVPRVGGVGIYIAIVAGAALAAFTARTVAPAMFWLLLCTAPALTRICEM